MSNKPSQKASYLVRAWASLVINALEEKYKNWVNHQRKDTKDEEFINKVMEENHKTAIEYIKGMLLG